MPSLVDSEILQGFVEEVYSYLPTIRRSLELYANGSATAEELDVAHRQIHTICGAASMVGLPALGKKARDMEEALEMFMQDSSLPLDADVMRAFLLQLDGIEQELNTLQTPANTMFAPEIAANFPAWPQDITPAPPSATTPPPAPVAPERNVDPELAEIFAEEAEEYLTAMREHLDMLAQEHDNQEVMRETRRYAHTLKGSAAMMGFPELSKLSKRIEETFDHLRDIESGVNSELLSIFNTAHAALCELAGGRNADSMLYELQVLHSQFDLAKELAAGPPQAAPVPHAPAPPPITEVIAAPPAATFEIVVQTDNFALPLPDFNELAAPPLPAFGEIVAPPAPEPAFVDAAPPPQDFDIISLPLPFGVGETREREEPLSETNSFLPKETAAPTPAEVVAEAPIPAPTIVSQEHDESAFDADMLEVFRLEAEEHIQNLSQNLETLANQPENRDALQEIRRSLHTLKGSAAMVNLDAVSTLSHRMEDLLDKLYEGAETMTPAAFSLLLTSTETLDSLARNAQDDALNDQLADLQTRFAAVLQPPAENLAQVTVEAAQTSEAAVEAAEAAPAPSETAFDIIAPAAPPAAESDAATREAALVPGVVAPSGQAGKVIRVPLARLDETVKLVSELLISRSMLEQKLTDMERQVQELRLSTARLQRASHRLESDYETVALGGGWVPQASRRAAGEPLAEIITDGNIAGSHLFQQAGNWNDNEFDELEFDRYTEFHRLSRELAETSGDTEAISQDCTLLLQDLDGLVLRQRRLVNELQERLMHLRMVPLGTLAPRLRRIVQVSAAQLGKSAELSLQGEQIELDTVVLDSLADPLLHLLRNAVAHGIEAPDTRRANNKMPTGTISLSVVQEGTEIIIRVSDDGCGLNLQAIRSKALNSGLIKAQDLATMTDEQVSALIFLPGFTTAGKIDQVSGRGVGMDIIQAAVMQLKGVITIDTTPGNGTTFTIRVPVALAVTRALVVRDHAETYAVPLNAVTRALTLDKAETETRDGKLFLKHENEFYPVVRLGEVLKLHGLPENRGNDLPVLLLKSGDYSIALAVDQLDESRDLVLKSLGAHLGRVPLLLGATIMGDGKVVPIINPVELVQQVATGSLDLQPIVRPRPAVKRTLTVMTVDDSPSVRRIMSNLLKAQDWIPLPAKDGFDALEILQQTETPPDIILLDMEMPRMDGYELLAALRKMPAWADVPMVMITSRAGDKHRRKAMELGASEYLIKPYQDEVLCATIRRLTHR
jgi:chemosensory pili system protein ChpA (sensor histidine kinase/response regulator)